MRYIALFLICSIYVLQVKAGAWNLDKGKAYTQFSFTYLNYGGLLNGSEKNIDLYRNISDYTIQLYTEYGLSKKINLVLNLPYKMVSSSDKINDVSNSFEDTLEAGKLSGLSNLNVGIKYLIIDKAYVLSMQLDFFNKTHQYNDESGLQIGYDAHLIYPSLLFGKGWDKYYLQIQEGLLLNSSNYSQNSVGNIEVGRKISKNGGYLIFRTDVKIPFTTGHYNERNSVQTGLFRDNSSYISPGLKWIQAFKNGFYMNVAAYGAFYSENEGNQATLNIGLAKTW